MPPLYGRTRQGHDRSPIPICSFRSASRSESMHIRTVASSPPPPPASPADVHNVRVRGAGASFGERGPGVSWQDELRKLDEELAAGQISADDYRVRRDQVLSSAVASSPDSH